MIDAVLFDLDDTLFPQEQWLDVAWRTVARHAVGIDEERFFFALRDVASEGSDRGRIIDRALERIGAVASVPPLVEIFRTCYVGRLDPYPGVARALWALRRRLPVGLVTDGDPAIQRSKLRALSLEDAFDAIVMSDDLGRMYRKPHPIPLLRAAKRLGVPPHRCVYVGDRPAKDVAAALAAGMRAVRVRTGEYASLPDDPPPWWSAADAIEAIDRLRSFTASPVLR